jgi:hypothetical protein
MSERHDRSVNSASSTILGYAENIRSLLSKEPQAGVNDRLSPGDSKEVEVALDNIKEIIKKYREEAGLQGEDLNVRWRIFVMEESMENMLYDIRPERLGKTYGKIESEEQAKRLDGLYDDLSAQVRRLKDVLSKK